MQKTIKQVTPLKQVPADQWLSGGHGGGPGKFQKLPF